MESNFTIEKKDNYTLIIGEGERNDLASLVEGTKKIQQIAKENNTNHLLLDYRKVKLSVPLTEAYNIVKIYEKKMPGFSNLVMAAVVKKLDWEIAKFWESVSNKRGYTFKVFSQMNEANRWLDEKIKSRSLS